MDLHCPSCNSSNTQNIEVAYEQSVRTSHKGFESVSAFGRKIAPPEFVNPLFAGFIFALVWVVFWFIGLTAAFLAIPLMGLLGTIVLWGLLPFLLGALWAVWAGLRRNQRDLSLYEVLVLSHDQIKITRHNPNGPLQEWDANPYWVELNLHPKGKVENYITLRGSDREVELGAFLSPEERLELHDELSQKLARLKRHC